MSMMSELASVPTRRRTAKLRFNADAAGEILLDGVLVAVGVGVALGSTYVGLGEGDPVLASFLAMGLPLAFLAGLLRDRWACLENARLFRKAQARCVELAKELDEAGDYAHRLLEDPAFYKAESAMVISVPDLPLRGYFAPLYGPTPAEVVA